MATSKTKGSASTVTETAAEAPATEQMSKMKAAVEVLIQAIVEGGNLARRP
jgi:hypothetical protein